MGCCTTTRARGLMLLVVFVLVSLGSSTAWAASKRKRTKKRVFQGRIQQMAVTANFRATRAALQVLRRGGNAMDAAIAAAFTLAVVEPYSSGLGGGGFLLYYRAKRKKVVALDFRERAPYKATPTMFSRFGKKGRKLSRHGHLGTGTPGFVSGLEAAHKRYGTRPWASLLEPARWYAQKGFRVYGLLAYTLRVSRRVLRKYASTRAVFFPKGKRLRRGQRLRQTDLAWTIRRLQRYGAKDFYRGEIAKRLVAEMKRGGGIMTLSDLKRYRPFWKKPVRGTYRDFSIASMGSPSSGGVHLVQMLNILSSFPIATTQPTTPLFLHWYTEAMRLAFADRAKFQGDAKFAKVPNKALLSPRYAAVLRRKISNKKAMRYGSVKAGPALDFNKKHTSHLSVIDRWGNAVAMTLTINRWFGCGVIAKGTGILLNDEMDDFTTFPGKPNAFGLIQSKANIIQPGKTPLSAMSPTLVFKNGQLRGALGSAGGPTIITAVTQLLLHLIDHKLTARKAMNSPRIHHQWRPYRLYVERRRLRWKVRRALRKMGHRIRQRSRWGNAQLLWVDDKGRLTGASDRRAVGRAQGF